MRLFFALMVGLLSVLHLDGAEQSSTPACVIEQTLSIIKPDAVAANHIGAILDLLENGDLSIVAAKMTRLSRAQAESFYAIHKDRPFFNDLVTFMSSGPVFVSVLEGPDAVAVNRKLIGATDPLKAEEGTVRAEYGISVQRNAIHGSDSPENAKKEIAFFFQNSDIFSRRVVD